MYWTKKNILLKISNKNGKTASTKEDNITEVIENEIAFDQPD